VTEAAWYEPKAEADYVRARGWVVGDVLEDTERPAHPRRVRITAIGEQSVLARQVYPPTNAHGDIHGEGTWTFRGPWAKWSKVPT